MKLTYPSINAYKLENKDPKTQKKLKILVIETMWYTLIPCSIAILAQQTHNPLVMALIIPMIILRVIDDEK